MNGASTMRKHFAVLAALILGVVLGLVGVEKARAITYTGQPLSATASVTSLTMTTAANGTAPAPVLFLAGNTGVNTAIQGGMFWCDTTCVLVFQDGSGGATIGVLGFTANVPLPVTPQHLGLGGAGQPGTGICTVTKGNGIFVQGPSGAGASSIHLSWTGPVNQQ